MKKNDIKIDGSKILISLFEKYKNESWVLSSTKIEERKNSIFGNKKWKQFLCKWSRHKYGLNSGITLTEDNEILFLLDNDSVSWDIKNLSLQELKNIIWFNINNKLVVAKKTGFETLVVDISDFEFNFFKEFIDLFSTESTKIIKSIQKNKEEELKSLNHSINKILAKLDKDGNGIIDVCEAPDDFITLFKKHQKIIIGVDKIYVQKFVKIGNYLKIKRQNIQELFSSIKRTNNISELENQVGILKNLIHAYELLLFHSLNMITSIVEEDLIVFYEIYESFDKLNVFNSNWENELSQKLTGIGESLNDLIYSIDTMERNIVSGLNELTYVTQEGYSMLNDSVTRELQSINSSIIFNNLLTGISTYQLYKINKQTKGLTK